MMLLRVAMLREHLSEPVRCRHTSTTSSCLLHRNATLLTTCVTHYNRSALPDLLAAVIRCPGSGRGVRCSPSGHGAAYPWALSRPGCGRSDAQRDPVRHRSIAGDLCREDDRSANHHQSNSRRDHEARITGRDQRCRASAGYARNTSCRSGCDAGRMGAHSVRAEICRTAAAIDRRSHSKTLQVSAQRHPRYGRRRRDRRVGVLGRPMSPDRLAWPDQSIAGKVRLCNVRLAVAIACASTLQIRWRR